MISAFIDFKALVFREESLIAQMPFSCKESFVTVLLKCFSNGHLFKWHFIQILWAY